MSLKSKIEQEIKAAMLAKQKERLTALRSIKSMILLAESEKGASGEVSEDTEMKLLTKAAKQRKDSITVFEEQGRADLAEKEKGELSVIEEFLPKQLSKEEIEMELKSIIEKVGASSPKDMGKVMGVASKALAGRADGKVIAEIVKQLLNS